MLTFCIFQRSVPSFLQSSSFISSSMQLKILSVKIKPKRVQRSWICSFFKAMLLELKPALLRDTISSHLLPCHLLVGMLETRSLTGRDCSPISHYSICFRIYKQSLVRKKYFTAISVVDALLILVYLYFGFFHSLFLVFDGTINPTEEIIKRVAT